MDLMNGDNLESIIKQKIKSNSEIGGPLTEPIFFSEAVIWRCLIQCLLAMEFMHSKQIIHRDIKSANIFVHAAKSTTEKRVDELLADAEFKIGDFNIACYTMTGFQSTLTGTPFFASPEMLNKKTYSYSNDVWQLGVAMYQFAYLKLPYHGKTIPEIKKNQKSIDPFLDVPSHYSQQLKLTLQQMMQYNPKKRLLPRQLLDSIAVKRWIN